ncbi:MAG: prepilin peptidase [Pyrinomonadaceae bacterium]|nr:prepilin peptidase [Acidobacteriota bacterium]
MSILLTSFEALTGLPEAISYAFVFLFGSIVGSFLNVVIHRVPNEQSIVFPNSACPNCKMPIKAYDNIPIFSWIILWGKCRGCKAPISARYPAVELLTALLFVLVYWQIGLNPFLPVCLVFAAAIVALVFIDAEHMILPNVITYPLLIFTLLVRIVFPLIFGWEYFSDMRFAPATYFIGYPAWLVSLIGAFLGALAGGGSLWLVGEAWKRFRGVDAMGLGDVKMMLGVGALLGWRLAILAIFLAAFSGAVIGVAVIARQKEKDFQTQIPFGIFLGIGSLLALLFGEQMIAWYLGRFVT